MPVDPDPLAGGFVAHPLAEKLDRLPFSDALARAQEQVEFVLTGPMGPLATHDDILHDAMKYAVIGGKGLRGFLVIEGARLFGYAYSGRAIAATAVECLHAYSLVHDDLPCMDDDDLRRGQPTVHRKWDEATAVLVGDALHTLAFELLAAVNGSTDAAKVRLIQTLAAAAGRTGMVGGQMMDIAAESAASPLSLEEITTLQDGKTGALIQWSAAAGAMLAGEDETALTQYGTALGLAFQIADDILDIEGDAATVGKAVGKDADAGKATFVSHLGLDGAKRRAASLVDQACDVLSPYKEDAETLREAARFVIERKR